MTRALAGLPDGGLHPCRARGFSGHGQRLSDTLSERDKLGCCREHWLAQRIGEDNVATRPAFPIETPEGIETSTYALRDSMLGRTGVSEGAPTCLRPAAKCIGVQARASGLLPALLPDEVRDPGLRREHRHA